MHGAFRSRGIHLAGPIRTNGRTCGDKNQSNDQQEKGNCHQRYDLAAEDQGHEKEGQMVKQQKIRGHCQQKGKSHRQGHRKGHHHRKDRKEKVQVQSHGQRSHHHSQRDKPHSDSWAALHFKGQQQREKQQCFLVDYPLIGRIH